MAEDKKIELVAHRDQPHRSSQIGLGMLSSVVVGFSPLRDALQGNGSFEYAIGRYLACLGFCIGAAIVIGRLLDAAPEARPAASDTDRTSTEVEVHEP